MAIQYLRSGEDAMETISAKKMKPTSDRRAGELALSQYRLVYQGGNGREIADISLDAIQAMEYTRQSAWNQWTASGVLMFFLTFVTQALFGFLASSFEGFTQFSWLSVIPLLMMGAGVVLLLYGVLNRKQVFVVRTGNAVYEFASKQNPQRLMHGIRSAR